MSFFITKVEKPKDRKIYLTHTSWDTVYYTAKDGKKHFFEPKELDAKDMYKDFRTEKSPKGKPFNERILFNRYK